MSDTAALGRRLSDELSVPEWLSPAEHERSHLVIAADAGQRRARPKALYALIAVGVLMAIVIAQLLASIAVTNNAFELQTLQAKQKTLSRAYQVAAEADQKVESPQYLAANATALGMVPGSRAGFLQLSTGQVVGAPPQTGTAASSPNLIANEQLQNVPLVTGTGTVDQSAASSATAAQNAAAGGATTSTAPAGSTAGSQASATPATPATPAASTPVVLGQTLPSPQTH